jgi:hypothetical protein
MEDLKGSHKLKGVQAVAEALRSEDFPMDKFSVNYCVGDMKVEDLDGRTILIREVMDQIHENEFRSTEELMRAIHSILRRPKTHAA